MQTNFLEIWNLVQSREPRDEIQNSMTCNLNKKTTRPFFDLTIFVVKSASKIVLIETSHRTNFLRYRKKTLIEWAIWLSKALRSYSQEGSLQEQKTFIKEKHEDTAGFNYFQSFLEKFHEKLHKKLKITTKTERKFNRKVESCAE